jgi:hypothetical protein
MTGLVPVIHLVGPPERFGSGRKRRHVDGRDKPGHDGGGGFSPFESYTSAYGARRRGEILSRFRDFSRRCSQENFAPRRAANSAAGRSYPQATPRKRSSTTGGFSIASSEFKTIGAFFCNSVTPDLPPISRAPVYQML